MQLWYFQAATVFHMVPNVPGWEFHQPVRVLVEVDDDGTYVVSDDIFAQYGEGSTAAEALNDYAQSLGEYLDLIESRAKDHKPNALLIQRFRSMVTKSGITPWSD
jgi:hypothetical protein